MMKPLPRRPAVTLLELLVTIAATIVLTFVLIVTIRGVRGQTLVMQDLNNLRLSAQDMLVWSVEHDGMFLNIGRPGSPEWQMAFPPDISPPGTSNPAPGSDWSSIYWSQQTGWNRILNAYTGRVAQHWQSAFGLVERPRPTVPLPPGAVWPAPPEPGTRLYAVHPTRFMYSSTLLSAAELWEVELGLSSPLDTLAYLKPVRMSMVRHPSAKGIFINMNVPTEQLFHHAAYVDGSAERRAPEDFIEAAMIPSGQARGAPVLHTRYGYRGRDR